MYRDRHIDTPDLVWDAALQQSSQEWANHLAQLGRLEHSVTRGAYGENLAFRSASEHPTPCKDAVERWYVNNSMFACLKITANTCSPTGILM